MRLKPIYRTRQHLVLPTLLCALAVHCFAQGVTVTGNVTTYGGTTTASSVSAVWLTPVPLTVGDLVPVQPVHSILRQKNKSFEPHLLVVTKGSTVDFPNLDPWFHNVFSLFNGKKFDLGLYEAGTSRTVHFDREGISYIFCNIHPEMSAVVVVVSSPYYTVVNKGGQFSIASVPPGRYLLRVWNENALPETLAELSRQVEIGDTPQWLGTLRIRESESAMTQHKNKYGREYEPPSPTNPVYAQPQ